MRDKNAAGEGDPNAVAPHDEVLGVIDQVIPGGLQGHYGEVARAVVQALMSFMYARGIVKDPRPPEAQSGNFSGLFLR